MLKFACVTYLGCLLVLGDSRTSGTTSNSRAPPPPRSKLFSVLISGNNSKLTCALCLGKLVKEKERLWKGNGIPTMLSWPGTGLASYPLHGPFKTFPFISSALPLKSILHMYKVMPEVTNQNNFRPIKPQTTQLCSFKPSLKSVTYYSWIIKHWQDESNGGWWGNHS